MEKKDYGDKKTELLVKVARMYYEDSMSQEEIASEIACSRPYVSRLLTDAKEMGIVQFKVVPPKGYELEMERRLRERVALRRLSLCRKKVIFQS